MVVTRTWCQLDALLCHFDISTQVNVIVSCSLNSSIILIILTSTRQLLSSFGLYKLDQGEITETVTYPCPREWTAWPCSDCTRAPFSWSASLLSRCHRKPLHSSECWVCPGIFGCLFKYHMYVRTKHKTAWRSHASTSTEMSWIRTDPQCHIRYQLALLSWARLAKGVFLLQSQLDWQLLARGRGRWL